MSAKTYTFSTFQELVDRVPVERIRDCMEELGAILAIAKESALLAVDLHRDRAGLPPIEEGPGLIEIRDPFKWVDDGKRELQSDLLAQDGEHILTTKLVSK